MSSGDTSLSLLQEARAGSDRAWERLTDLYQPFIASWARKHAPVPQDGEDLAQEILLQVFRHLPRFEHNGRPGAFRCWLRTIAVHVTHDFWLDRQREPHGTGDTNVLVALEQLNDSTSSLAQAWDHEHDQFILNRLLEQVAAEFQPQSIKAFRRLALENVPAAMVAAELNMKIGAVYTAKSRVLQRLRQLSAGLLDWGEQVPG